MDRISNLPDIAIENILKYLPLRDVVRTSVLSRSWRELWRTVPQLIFDQKGFPHSRNEKQRNYERRLRRAVDQVFLLHQGSIHKFKLSIARTCCRDIDRWIHVLSRRGVEEFILHILQGGGHYRLPFYFFSFKELTYLELRWCMFDPPSNFSGYSKLTVLNLSGVVFTNDGLALLLSICPLLKKLLLTDLSGCTSLRINSQKLVEFSVDGRYIPVYLECAPLLATVSIKYPKYFSDVYSKDEMVHHNIVNIFGDVPSLERLTVHDFAFESSAVGDIPVTLPILLPLRHLSIEINFEYMKELLAAFCILRSSLMLKKLVIQAHYFGGGGISDDFWRVQDFSSAFNHLKIVEICKFAGTRNQLKLIQLIFANAPVLEKLQIKFLANIDESKILSELIGFPRSSTKAEIIVPAACMNCDFVFCLCRQSRKSFGKT